MAADNNNVAIDGPVASGKTVTANALAQRLGYLYLDTGAMYRAVAYLALDEGIDADNEPVLLDALRQKPIEVVSDSAVGQGYRVRLGGVDITSELTSTDVTAVVSTVSALPGIRARLAERQREIAGRGTVVMAGRDIGTVVLPDARFKFFLTAELEERVARRAAELAASGHPVDLGRLRMLIEERDRIDMTRATAPLRAAADAVVIDSTGIPAQAVVDRMLTIIQDAA